MYNGIFLGLTTVDIVYYLPCAMQENRKQKADRQLLFAGGPAGNASVAFAAFDNRAVLVTGIGQEPVGQLIKQELLEHRVAVIDSTDQPRRPPILSSIIVDLSTGNRSVVYSNTDMRTLRREAANKTLLEDADILLLDGYYLTQAVQMAAWARELGVPVVLDGGSWKEGLEELLPLVDYAICSRTFFPPGVKDEAGVVAVLHRAGIPYVAITRDGDPILVSDADGTAELPVMQVRPVDTLGAGDIFHGAFCHYILGNGFRQSLERAAEVASLSCTSLGTRAWISQMKFV
ncbi:MAG: PfkB family carbohydrate kinase [Desulfobulbus sp.]|jgi:sugar/nucleoside kinase (ribokinase family)